MPSGIKKGCKKYISGKRGFKWPARAMDCLPGWGGGGKEGDFGDSQSYKIMNSLLKQKKILLHS